MPLLIGLILVAAVAAFSGLSLPKTSSLLNSLTSL